MLENLLEEFKSRIEDPKEDLSIILQEVERAYTRDELETLDYYQLINLIKRKGSKRNG